MYASEYCHVSNRIFVKGKKAKKVFEQSNMDGKPDVQPIYYFRIINILIYSRNCCKLAKFIYNWMARKPQIKWCT